MRDEERRQVGASFGVERSFYPGGPTAIFSAFFFFVQCWKKVRGGKVEDKDMVMGDKKTFFYFDYSFQNNYNAPFELSQNLFSFNLISIIYG